MITRFIIIIETKKIKLPKEVGGIATKTEFSTKVTLTKLSNSSFASAITLPAFKLMIWILLGEGLRDAFNFKKLI